MPVQLKRTFRDDLAAATKPLVGMWLSSGSVVVAEICAGSELDWLLIDMEHSPNDLRATLAQLQAIAAYPITPVVRLPVGEIVMIKQVLDLGAQNLLVPMVSSAEYAREIVAAVHYPPRGRRGVGSALARSARWARVDNYLGSADDHVSLFAQIESADGVRCAADIAAVDGIDGVYVGPADLAASMGLIGQQTHPDVLAAVHSVFEAARRAGKPYGVNAFDPKAAHAYLDEGASFISVGADVTLLARGSDGLAREFHGGAAK
ncbi:MAG: HpcH/HpaI aldolase/citrate lyase family protein [Nakamurella sp.]